MNNKSIRGREIGFCFNFSAFRRTCRKVIRQNLFFETTRHFYAVWRKQTAYPLFILFPECFFVICILHYVLLYRAFDVIAEILPRNRMHRNTVQSVFSVVCRNFFIHDVMKCSCVCVCVVVVVYLPREVTFPPRFI